MPLSFRLLFYACLGVAAEVVFTAVCARLGLIWTPDMDDHEARAGWRLKGHSFVWMLPVYGTGLAAFEVLHDLVRGEPWFVRGAAYVGVLYAIELAASVLLVRLTGAHVWRWVGRGSVAGHVHVAMAPLWFMATLALEPVVDLLVRASAP